MLKNYLCFRNTPAYLKKKLYNFKNLVDSFTLSDFILLTDKD